MKTAIIGAGNMGGSIARGLAKGSIIPASDIIVSNPSQGKLDKLKAEFPALQTTHDNQEAVTGAEFIILAVKPPAHQARAARAEAEKQTNTYLRCRRHLFRRTGTERGRQGNDHVPHHPQHRRQRNGEHDAHRQPQRHPGAGTTDAGHLQPDGPCLAHPRRKIRRRHFHDFLRHRIRTEVHPGSHASRHRNGHLPPRTACAWWRKP